MNATELGNTLLIQIMTDLTGRVQARGAAVHHFVWSFPNKTMRRTECRRYMEPEIFAACRKRAWQKWDMVRLLIPD
jgi:hypothetical protein